MHTSTDRAQLIAECANTTTLQELAAIAIREAQKFPGGCHIVCGPISTGGQGSPEANVRVLEKTIAACVTTMHPIFDQSPYEQQLAHFHNQWVAEDPEERAGSYCEGILSHFYLPLLQSKAIVRTWFIPGWESSYGASWERRMSIEFGIPYADIDASWFKRFVLDELQ
jgi:hypothetical protein